ncbi:hypothetical protein STPH2_1075 [Streptomyces sp. KO7888]|nr:hypothetical protein [Streptomyces sp. KO7888]
MRSSRACGGSEPRRAPRSVQALPAGGCATLCHWPTSTSTGADGDGRLPRLCSHLCPGPKGSPFSQAAALLPSNGAWTRSCRMVSWSCTARQRNGLLATFPSQTRSSSDSVKRANSRNWQQTWVPSSLLASPTRAHPCFRPQLWWNGPRRQNTGRLWSNMISSTAGTSRFAARSTTAFTG